MPDLGQSGGRVEFARRWLNEHVPTHVFRQAAEGRPDAEETIVRGVLDALAAYEDATHGFERGDR